MNISDRLAAPFAAAEIRWKPQAVQGNRALAIPYLNARAVMDRLDEVVGVDGWEDSYDVMPDGAAVCTLRLRIGERVVTKQDVGGPSEQPDEGDRRKAAFSDALKRAAVKFGVGRYLYGLPKVWADYDPQKRQFVKPPSLPASALPAKPQTNARPGPDASKTSAGKSPFDRIKTLRIQAGQSSEEVMQLAQHYGYTGKPKDMPAAIAERVIAHLETLAEKRSLDAKIAAAAQAAEGIQDDIDNLTDWLDKCATEADISEMIADVVKRRPELGEANYERLMQAAKAKRDKLTARSRETAVQHG